MTPSITGLKATDKDILHLLAKFKKRKIVSKAWKGQATAMTFGERIRQLRKAKNLNQQQLADKVGINFTYLSKIENNRLTTTDFPSEDTIKKLAKYLGADADELLLMAKKVPDSIRKRVIERPDAFRKFASLDDETIDKLLEELGDE